MRRDVGRLDCKSSSKELKYFWCSMSKSTGVVNKGEEEDGRFFGGLEDFAPICVCELWAIVVAFWPFHVRVGLVAVVDSMSRRGDGTNARARRRRIWTINFAVSMCFTLAQTANLNDRNILTTIYT